MCRRKKGVVGGCGGMSEEVGRWKGRRRRRGEVRCVVSGEGYEEHYTEYDTVFRTVEAVDEGTRSSKKISANPYRQGEKPCPSECVSGVGCGPCVCDVCLGAVAMDLD